MIELAGNFGNGPMLVDIIARRQGISSKYIHLLANGLRSAGLVRAARGRNGGYELAKPPSSITALDVVAALEREHAPAECATDPSTCAQSHSCAARDVWCDVAAAVDGVLSGITLADLSARQCAKLDESLSFSI
jgi:Rrf2 family protein